MIDPQDFWLTNEQVQAHLARQRNGQRKRQGRKPLEAGFLKVSIGLAHKLREENANGDAWAIVMALSEAWFTTGLHGQHPNPFPLSNVDFKRWGFTRKQKSRTLLFLTRIHLISVDRREPENSLVTIAWEPRYQPEV